MSTNKHFPAVCAVVLALALLVTVLFMNGKRLGIQTIRDEDAEESESSRYFTANDLKDDWAAATRITLSGTEASVSGGGAYAAGGSVTIAAAGYYEVSGTLTDGSLIVDAGKNDKVFLRLNGVSLICPDDAAIRVNQADKVFLTLAAGTENTVTSGSTYSAAALADKTDGAIFSHDDLTINGSGSLIVTAGYKHGIAANDSLRITGGTIAVTAPADTIHVNDSLHIAGANITLEAGDDAVHSDTFIAVLGGSLAVTGCYEGIEAPEILIEDGTLTVTSTDDGINACGTRTADGSLPGVTINGGTITLLNPSGRDADGIDSNGNIDINGGVVYISLVGDGGNCALDYGSENGGVCRINGGIVVACGGSTMLETMSDTSAQPSLLYASATSQAAGTQITLQDSGGETLLTYVAPNGFSAVLLSCPAMETGSTYTLTLGGTSQEISLDQVAAAFGVTGGMGDMGGRGGPGGMNGSVDAAGGMKNRGEHDDSGAGAPTPPEGGASEAPSGDSPARPDRGNDGHSDTRPALPEDAADGGAAQTPPEQMPQSARTPSGDTPESADAAFTLDGTGKWLLAVSAAVLILGLAAAIAYRKKG